MNNWYNAHNIFLQHGVIINDLRWLSADRSRFDMFVTSAVPETKYIKKDLDIRKGLVVQLCGLPRFDNLHNRNVKRNRIVIMPTWRYWFNLKSKEQAGLDSDFLHSSLLKSWKALLESHKLAELIDEYKLEVIFYPHRNLQYHLPDMKKMISTKVTIASWKDYDIQELLKSSEMMITDYSSVFFDMVYMKKPVIFYQFDLEEFRKGQYEQGYFDYNENPFGKSCRNPDEVLSLLEGFIKSGYKYSKEYLTAHKRYFLYYDSSNSERVYKAVKQFRRK